MFRAHRIALAVAFAALLLVPGVAGAQTLTINEAQFERDNINNDSDPPDPDLGDPRRNDASGTFGGINREECLRGENWHLEGTTSGLAGSTLYIYTGTSCDQKINRDGDGDDCKLIDSIVLTDAAIAHEFDIPANEIANTEDDSCDDIDDHVKLWFLPLAAEGDEETTATAVSFPSTSDILVRTRLPDAPTDVHSGPGENRAEIEWDGALDGQEFFVACSPQPGDQGLDPTGEPTFDSTGQEICAGEPPTPGFAADAVLDRAWRCDPGSGDSVFADGISAQSASIEDLDNDVQYFFAVVALDDVGNPSLLSEITCSTPKPVDDFFELYRRAGGSAGGGICAAAPGAPRGAAGGLALLIGLAGIALRRRRACRVLTGTVVATAVMLSAAAASADGLRYLQDDYRSPQNFALEIRGGPYYPAVDDEFGGNATPFEDSFEDHSRLRAGFEVDWQALRTPVASLGIGFAGSLIRYVGTARFEGSGEVSSEETTLIVVPLVLQAVVRFDFAVREWQIPLAPYAKIGFATYLWFSEDGDGTARADSEGGEPDAVLGAGRTHGLEVAGGLAFLLDFLEPNAARKLDTDGGVNHSYLFVELMWASVDGFGASSVLDLSDTTWNVGLLLEI